MTDSATARVDAIVRLVSVTFGVLPEEIRSKNRHQSIMVARHACYWLARFATSPRLSFPEIARGIGNRDHTTVMAGLAKAQRRIDRDEWFAKSIRKLRAQLVPLGGDVDHAPVIPPTEFDARDALEVSLHG